MIDSHCPLIADQFSTDRDAVISRARAAGISPLIIISDDLEESHGNIDIASNYDDIFCTVGIHPHNSSNFHDGDIESLRQLSQNQKVVGIGEIGLDYYYMNSPKDIQKVVFEKQLRLAKELELPAIIHTRESMEDTQKIIDSVQFQSLVFHAKY